MLNTRGGTAGVREQPTTIDKRRGVGHRCLEIWYFFQVSCTAVRSAKDSVRLTDDECYAKVWSVVWKGAV